MWKIPPFKATHRPRHPPLTLWPLSLTSRWAPTLARWPQTWKQSQERFFFSIGGMSTWPSGRDYGWAPLFGCWVWSIVTVDSLEDPNDSLLQPLHLRHFLSHLGSSEVQNMNQWWAIQLCLFTGLFALVTLSPVVGTNFHVVFRASLCLIFWSKRTVCFQWYVEILQYQTTTILVNL